MDIFQFATRFVEKVLLYEEEFVKELSKTFRESFFIFFFISTEFKIGKSDEGHPFPRIIQWLLSDSIELFFIYHLNWKYHVSILAKSASITLVVLYCLCFLPLLEDDSTQESSSPMYEACLSHERNGLHSLITSKQTVKCNSFN